MCLLTDEAGTTLLSKSFGVNGSWDQRESLDLNTMLNAANGGVVEWETCKDIADEARRFKQSTKGDLTRPLRIDDGAPTRLPVTNVTIGLAHQVGHFRDWWARVESRKSSGLSVRFLFSFGNAPLGESSRYGGFMQSVLVPIAKFLFRSYLYNIGPNAATDDDFKTKGFRMETGCFGFARLITRINSSFCRRITCCGHLTTAIRKFLFFLAK